MANEEEVKKPPAFMVDANLRRKLKDFSPEEVGNALLRACAYFDLEDFDYEGLTRFETILLHDFQELIERDSARYRRKCRQNKKNISKRWSKKDTNEYDGIRSYTNEYEGIRNIPNTNTNTNTNTKSNSNTGIKDSLKESFIPSNKTRDGIELSPPGDRLGSKPSDKPSEEEIASMFGNFMNRQRNRLSSEDREAHLQSVGFYDMTAAEKIAFLEEERRRKRANS